MVDVGALAAVLDGLAEADPATLADGETVVALHAQYERLGAIVTRATGRFDAGGKWAADGARTAAAWISTRCRLPIETARRRVGRARALPSMPAGEGAWLAGRIGEAQVGALRTAQSSDAEAYARDEAVLVEQAATLQHRQLLRVVDYWRELNEPDDVERRADKDREARSAHLSRGMRGTGFLNATFDAIGFDIFRRALGSIEDELFEDDWRAARRERGDDATKYDVARTPAQRRLDALVVMARRALAVPEGGRLPDPLFVAHVGEEAAARMCELADGTVVAPGSLVPWLHDAWVERVAAAADRTHNLSVRQRLFTNGTRRAVEIRYRECFHEYCDVPVEQCEIDHVQPWAAGGLTIDTNGQAACAFHNRQKGDRPPPPDPDEDLAPP